MNFLNFESILGGKVKIITFSVSLKTSIKLWDKIAILRAFSLICGPGQVVVTHYLRLKVSGFDPNKETLFYSNRVLDIHLGGPRFDPNVRPNYFLPYLEWMYIVGYPHK